MKASTALHGLLTIVLLALVVVLSIILGVMQTVQQTPPEVIHTETRVIIDSTPPPPIVIRMNQQPPPPPVIIYPDDNGQPLPMSEVDTTQHLPAKLYVDSTEDENQTIYNQMTVRGELLAHSTSYKLKIPTVVTKTIETTKTVQQPVNRLFLIGGVGLTNQLDIGFEVGVQFVSAKGWAAGYEYDIRHQAHELKIGVPLYQFEPPNRVF